MSAELRTAVADMHDLSPVVDAGSQDVVLVIFGLLFAVDAVRCLTEIRRALAPGGVAVIQTWHFNSVMWEIILAVQKHLGIYVGEDDAFAQQVLRWGREDILSRALRAA